MLPAGTAECVNYVAFYHRVLDSFFITINMINAAALAPTSTCSCSQRISCKKESVPHVFNCLPTLVCCSLRAEVVSNEVVLLR